jgi:hypothetical protein
VTVIGRPAPSVGLTSSPNPSTNNQPVTFTATVAQLPTNVTVDHFEWDFGDGSGFRTTTASSTTHVYTLTVPTIGATYTVNVTAVLSDGTRASSSTEQRVNGTTTTP